MLTCVSNVKIIPVLVVDDVAIAKDLAAVLVDAGLPVLEVTLRTPNAFSVIEQMADVEGAVVGAGTVLSADHVTRCLDSGAKFLVSPGSTDSLIGAACSAGLPLLPGAATASETMVLFEKGFTFLKFFPAEANGGVNALKALSSPLPGVQFCPTGGVSLQNMNDYLSLANVPVVGGSWLVNNDDVRNRDWKSIASKALAINRTD